MFQPLKFFCISYEIKRKLQINIFGFSFSFTNFVRIPVYLQTEKQCLHISVIFGCSINSRCLKVEVCLRLLISLSKSSGAGCSKLTTSLVNVSLKFQTSKTEICQYFLLKKCEKLLQCKSFSHFFKKKFQCIWL